MRRSARTRWTAVNRLTGVLRRSRVLRTAHVEPVALFPSPSLPAAAAGERTRWGQLRTTIHPGVGEITAMPATKLRSRRSTAARRALRRRSSDAPGGSRSQDRNSAITRWTDAPLRARAASYLHYRKQRGGASAVRDRH